MLSNFVLPTPTAQPADRSYTLWRNWWMQYSDRLYAYLSNWITQQLSTQFNTLLNGFGPDIASAATINVTNLMHRVTGSTSIATINGPPGAVGPLFLYAENGFSLIGGGNITPPLTVAPGFGVTLAYHPVAQLWVGTTVTSGAGGTIEVGPVASMPAAGVAGRMYFANDINQLFVDNGLGSWVGIA